jgi:hypothetical protein
MTQTSAELLILALSWTLGMSAQTALDQVLTVNGNDRTPAALQVMRLWTLTLQGALHRAKKKNSEYRAAEEELAPARA